ncbi:MAG: hypothetical protein WCA81_20130 [Rhizomicrobium sp.]
MYVGQAGNGNKGLFDRLKSHETDRHWNRWRHFSWFGFRGVNAVGNKLSNHDKVTKVFRETGGDLLNHMQGILIAATEPKLNRKGASWSGADEYFQYIEEEDELPTLQYLATKLETIEQKIDLIAPSPKLRKG